MTLEEHQKTNAEVMASTNEALTVHKIETVKTLESHQKAMDAWKQSLPFSTET